MNNLLCIFSAIVGIAVIAAECCSDEFDRISPYSGAQPGAACEYDYELDNTLPPTYAE
ncbi:hypothetical protein [Fibrobacter sp.]|uniref:hypothetical protein n=1 Tax=Fibrobacter sp. TaxID=35828 RepID=UPI0025BDD4B2|nr:hypothetical protein [Fibrobacter sp.]MBR4008172.1 hypothetical protein [Fibrobacter sp.]